MMSGAYVLSLCENADKAHRRHLLVEKTKCGK